MNDLGQVYDKALKLTEKFQSGPEGLTEYVPQGKSDQIQIK